MQNLTLIEQFKKYDVSPKNQYIIGVSGGIDSMVLMDMCIKENIPCTIVHIDHNIRQESPDDAQFVKKYAVKNNIPIIIEEIDIPKLAKEKKQNLEKVARDERYRIFEKYRKFLGSVATLTAHHKNDLYESVILHKERGSKDLGKIGMRMWDEKRKILRPLLHVSKEDIKKYAEKNKIEWREDSTNKDLQFSRNRIRSKLHLYDVEKIEHDSKVAECKVNEMDRNISKFLNQTVWNVQEITNMGDDLLGHLIIRLKQKYDEDPSYSEKELLSKVASLRKMQSGKKIELTKNIFIGRVFDKFQLQEKSIKDIKQIETNAHIRDILPGDTLLCISKEGIFHKKLKKVWSEYKISVEDRKNYKIQLSPEGEGIALIGEKNITYIT